MAVLLAELHPAKGKRACCAGRVLASFRPAARTNSLTRRDLLSARVASFVTKSEALLGQRPHRDSVTGDAPCVATSQERHPLVRQNQLGRFFGGHEMMHVGNRFPFFCLNALDRFMEMRIDMRRRKNPVVTAISSS